VLLLGCLAVRSAAILAASLSVLCARRKPTNGATAEHEHEQEKEHERPSTPLGAGEHEGGGREPPPGSRMPFGGFLRRYGYGPVENEVRP
jgi:hypothetical protein